MADGQVVRRRVRIRDVAQAAGVSVATVSNVLNNPGVVAPETLGRVQATMEDLSFVPNPLARQLRGGRTRAMGAIFLDVASPFHMEVARGMEDRLAEDGFILVVSSSDRDTEKEIGCLALFEEQGVRAILAQPTSRDHTVFERAIERGTPTVLIGPADGGEPRDRCSVHVDNVRGSGMVAAHLVAEGHRRIAFTNDRPEDRPGENRAVGVREALVEAGLDPTDALIEVQGVPDADGGEEALDQVLQMNPRPTAIACFNDYVALGVLRGLQRRGISVPDEMAVAGYDDTEFATMLGVPLTSVRMPKHQLGYAAADLMIEETEKPEEHRHRHVQFQPELVVRESTRPVRRSAARRA
ncbi:LacI family DNA-binding transcriptional regulator [Ruania rhizosphaerae]|uniref:LacI family DNA-binding transcriptional regulator n=1 Tax=Ruania rhizosphaerae TaxID=1840413 RepID=UPI00135824CA|nr:LacI family DNA-binding transcriptional regulator [Ruania rhizosphaerae]